MICADILVRCISWYSDWKTAVTNYICADGLNKSGRDQKWKKLHSFRFSVSFGK